MSAPERFECHRVVLRRPLPSDAAAMYTYASDEETTRYLAWPRHRSLDDTHAFLEHVERAWERDGVGAYAIVSRAGELLGSTGIDVRAEQRGVTGYVIARPHWGLGYASEALGGIVEIAGAIGLRELGACVHPDNAASMRVLEKCGFTRVAACSSRSGPARENFPNLALDGPIPVFDYALSLPPRS